MRLSPWSLLEDRRGWDSRAIGDGHERLDGLMTSLRALRRCQPRLDPGGDAPRARRGGRRARPDRRDLGGGCQRRLDRVAARGPGSPRARRAVAIAIAPRRVPHPSADRAVGPSRQAPRPGAQQRLPTSLLEDHLEFSQLEDAPVRLRVVATDVLSGQDVLLSSGGAVDAILASAAILGVFRPVRVAGRDLIDGGVVTNTRRCPTPWRRALTRSGCFPPAIRARSRSHPGERWPWSCTASLSP